MDVLGLVNIPGWLITITFIVLVLYLYSKWKQSLWKRLGVPGPEPTLYIGNMSTYLKKGACFTDLEYVKTYGNVVGIYQCNQPTLLVADPEMIKEMLIKEFQAFSNRAVPVGRTKRMLAGVALATDTHWKFLRNTLSPTFTSGKLKTMVHKIDNCCQSLVENITQQRKGGQPVDMKEACGAYTMDVISSTAFGLDINSQKEPNNKFVYYGKKAAVGAINRPFVLFMMMFPFVKQFLRLQLGNQEVVKFFRTALESAVKLRQEGKEKYNDFLQLMLNARHDDAKEEKLQPADLREYKHRGLNQLEIEANSTTFFIAGYDTTANTLSFACYALATHPDIQDRVVDEIDTVLNGEKLQYDDIGKLQYLDRFFSEVLRLYGAAVRFNRTCTKDTKIQNIEIPNGTDVTVAIFALHRNPKYWPDPEKFDPDRFIEENKAKRPEYSYLPFGVGPRICLGMRLALLEAKMALVHMLQSFTFSTCDKTEIPVTFAKGFLLRAQNEIFLSIDPRSSE